MDAFDQMVRRIRKHVDAEVAKRPIVAMEGDIAAIEMIYVPDGDTIFPMPCLMCSAGCEKIIYYPVNVIVTFAVHIATHKNLNELIDAQGILWVPKDRSSMPPIAPYCPEHANLGASGKEMLETIRLMQDSVQ